MFLCVSSTSRPLSIIITPSEASKLEWESHSLNSIKCIMCVYPKTAANNETDNIPLVRINIIFDFLFRPLFSCFRRINQESEVLPLEFVLGELLFCGSTAWLAIVFSVKNSEARCYCPRDEAFTAVLHIISLLSSDRSTPATPHN